MVHEFWFWVVLGVTLRIRRPFVLYSRYLLLHPVHGSQIEKEHNE